MDRRNTLLLDIQEMKKIALLFIGIFTCISGFSQNTWGDMGTRQSAGFNVMSAMPVDVNSVYEKLSDTTSVARKYESKKVWFRDVRQFWTWTGLKWAQDGSGGTGSGIIELSVAPTCSIELSESILEFSSSGNTYINISWSVTAPEGCKEIVSIVVDGQSITPTGGSQSGTLNTTVANNIDKEFTIQVNSSDKSASASTNLVWQWKQYWGRTSSTTLTSSDILSLTGAGVGAGSKLTASLAGEFNGINGDGERIVFASLKSLGVPAFLANGMLSTAFTESEITVTNDSGGSALYLVWISNTPYNSPVAQFSIR